jgi:O-antigen/teichoic acid export membrane protein
VQIASAIAQIAGTLSTAYVPELQSSYINANMEKMRKTMSMIVMSFVYIFLLGTVGFVIIGLPVLRMIKPGTVVSLPILLGLCIYQFLLKFRNCYTAYFSCTNRIIYVNGFITSAILCVGLSFVMIGPLQAGVWGLIAAQIVSQAVYNVWHWPLLAHQEMELSVTDMVRIGTFETGKMIKSFLPKKR